MPGRSFGAGNMNLFDPPHEKILSWSPATFRAGAAIWGPAMERGLLDPSIPKSAHKLFRTAVVGPLALKSAEADPAGWSERGVKFIAVYTRNAVNAIPAGYQAHATRVLDAAQEAIRDFSAKAAPS